MKLLINITDLNKYKSRDKIPIECEICHKTFYSPKNDIQWALKSLTRNYLRFCSKKCRNIFYDHRQIIPCKQCGKSIKRLKCQINKYKYSFCSYSCSASYWNIHKTWGSNRSKLEKWLEQQLTLKYPTLEIQYNNRKEINAELDIYIPSLKLAFELNGIFHYEPIYGKNKLESFQSNDNRKFQSCLENKIELCIIDTHNVKYLKKERDKKFLDIITNIINTKLADK